MADREESPRQGCRSVSVIVIGNGPSAATGSRGDEIDLFDTVVRCNQFQCEPPFAEHVGRKTDVWFTCGDFTNDLRGATHRKKTFRHPDLYRQTIFVGFGNILGYRSFAKLKARYERKPTKDRLLGVCQELVGRLQDAMPLDAPVGDGRMHGIPSTGLLAIAHFLEIIGEPVVHIHGFDFFEGSENGAKHHYFAKYKRSGQHGWHTGEPERRLVDQWRAEGRVLSLIPEESSAGLGG